MKHLFVDTSALIALAKTNDDNHQKAASYLRELTDPFKLVTSDYVLDETATRLRASFGAQKAVFFCEKIFESQLYKIHFIDKKIFRLALEKMKKYADKELSLTDCTSFVLMEKYHITCAFTFDNDFKKAGFEMVP